MRDEQQAQRAIALYADMVRRICFLYLKNHADTEDIFQTVFLKYILYSGSFETDEYEKAWFARVTVNCCKDLLKSFFRKNRTALDEITEQKLAVEDQHDEVLDAVMALPEKYKTVIYLFYYEQYTAVEIAHILQKKENTVYTWLSRAKGLLRKTLGGEEFA